MPDSFVSVIPLAQKLGVLCTVCVNRIAHMKWNRGCNGLPKLVQPTVPSISFPVCNPCIYSYGKLCVLELLGGMQSLLQTTATFSENNSHLESLKALWSARRVKR